MSNWLLKTLISRNVFFIISFSLILLSMVSWLGIAQDTSDNDVYRISIRGIFLQDLFSSYSLSDIFQLLSQENLLKLPHTFLRYTLFSFGFFLMIYSFTKSLDRSYSISPLLQICIKYMIGLFFILNLITPDGLNIVSLFMTIASITYILFYKKNIILNYDEKILVSLLVLIFYFFMSSGSYHDSNIREIDNYTRFILAVPLYIFLRDIRISIDYLFLIINISSILIGLMALYAFLIDSQLRVFGFTSTATIYGNISMLHFLFSFIIFQYKNKSSKQTLLSLLGILFALIAIILSASRGPLLAIPLVFLFIILINKYFSFNLKHLLIGLACTIFVVQFSGLSNRITDGYNEFKSQDISNLSSSWKSTGSITQRLIIWQGSVNMIKKEPLYGVGLDNFNNELLSQIKNKNLSPVRVDPSNLSGGFNHAHNQYLDILAKTGIIGLLIFLSLLIVFLKIFYKSLKSQHDTKIVGLFGFITILSYSAFMMTHVVFSHNHSILFMLYTLIIFTSIISNKFNDKRKI